ncbi:hypothetical protein AKG34_07395 [Peribacillus butanolivorans]|uniref:hypothetical protein n=1 Tax=Peribacillus butanolivorans TaxID=421767 RepID=UPI0006A6BA38|nr:hypothetical protein [Peribacillus butanolivorans]KON68650.1 hypothetical protein AKG34_07395 [Peribacillus butanolivorans]
MYNTNRIRSRKALDKLKPHTPGKPLWEVKKEIGQKRVIKLASNENPIGPSPKAIEAITKSLSNLNRYPDAHAAKLKKTTRLSLSTQQLIITNGADELITLISTNSHRLLRTSVYMTGYSKHLPTPQAATHTAH